MQRIASTIPGFLVGLTLVTVYGLATFWQGQSQQGFHILLFTCMIVFIAVRAGRRWGSCSGAGCIRINWRLPACRDAADRESGGGRLAEGVDPVDSPGIVGGPGHAALPRGWERDAARLVMRCAHHSVSTARTPP